jgi:Tfp pilus assembly pilus retraction ATPase PilT
MNPNPDPTRAHDILGNLLIECATAHATDIHVHRGAYAFYRVRGRLTRVAGWGLVDKNGIVTEQTFDAIKEVFGADGDGMSTRMYNFRALPDTAGRRNPMQCRVQPAIFRNRQALIIRLQPETPPELGSVLSGPCRATIQHLTDAQGLNLVVGPVGGGKTTFAAALARHWANQDRHIVTFEDPIEYVLTASTGIIDQQDVRLTGFSNGIELAKAMMLALRADIDGLYLGETRSAKTLRAAMLFARTREPVVTTYHAGSIGDAISSLFNASKLPWELACSMIGTALHSVTYINLAYATDGTPVPVVMVLPVNNDQTIRQSILRGDQAKLAYFIDTACNGERLVEGAISRRMARQRAITAGATEASVEKALPADPR